MGETKQPRTAAATAVRVRRGDDKAADRLRRSGWLVIPPEIAKSCAHSTPACGMCVAAALQLEQS